MSRAAGKPSYVTAHRIAVIDKNLAFNLAYLLTSLVIEYGGGPIRITTRDKKMYFELAKTGWIRMEGQSVFDDDSKIQIVWNRVLDASATQGVRLPIAVTSPPRIVGTRRNSWYAIATVEGVDRVQEAWWLHELEND